MDIKKLKDKLYSTSTDRYRKSKGLKPLNKTRKSDLEQNLQFLTRGIKKKKGERESTDESKTKLRRRLANLKVKKSSDRLKAETEKLFKPYIKEKSSKPKKDKKVKYSEVTKDREASDKLHKKIQDKVDRGTERNKKIVKGASTVVGAGAGLLGSHLATKKTRQHLKSLKAKTNKSAEDIKRIKKLSAKHAAIKGVSTLAGGAAGYLAGKKLTK